MAEERGPFDQDCLLRVDVPVSSQHCYFLVEFVEFGEFAEPKRAESDEAMDERLQEEYALGRLAILPWELYEVDQGKMLDLLRPYRQRVQDGR